MRKLYILDEINEELYERFTKELDELLADHATKPIQLELSSQGGSQYVALAICGRITTCTAPIHCKAYGAVMSAATLILACCDKRAAAEETWFMVHDAEERVKGTALQVQRQAAQSLKEEVQWADLLDKYTGTSAAIWIELSQETTYFTTRDAKMYGIIDSILEGKKRDKSN